MSTVQYQQKWAEQWWGWQEIQEYAKDKDMKWSEQQCKDFLEEHEEEISSTLREVGDDLIDNWLYDIKSDLDDAKLDTNKYLCEGCEELFLLEEFTDTDKCQTCTDYIEEEDDN